MSAHHHMNLEADNGHEILFVCPEPACGRRLVLKRGGGLVVLDRGDFWALHSGGSEGLRISASVSA